MNFQVFMSTFVMIFFAELGDKTQIAALSASAGTKAGWSVFLGASSALVVATLIAVLVGSSLSAALPPKYLKLVAGAVFIVFGVLYLFEGMTKY